MKDILKITSTFKTKQSNDEDTLIIEGFANTTTKDRVGDVILQEAWTKGGLDNYLKNPIILAYHDHSRPIGSMLDYSVNSKGFSIVAEISKAAGDIYTLIKDGVIKTFSVGFRVREADYDTETDIFVIKDLELFEISAVSIPANTDSIFSVRKSLTEEALEDFKSEIKNMAKDKEKEETVKTVESTSTSTEVLKSELEASLEKKLNDNVNKLNESITAALELALESKEKEKMTEKTVVVETGAEKLLADITARMEAQEKSLTDALEGMRQSLKDKSDELEAIQKSKMTFEDKHSTPLTEKEIDDAVLIAKIVGKGISDTTFMSRIIEKSGAQHTPSTDWEQTFSTRIMDNIRQRLVVEPLFSTIAMQSVAMQIPTNPEAGLGEWIATSAFRSTNNSSTGTAVDHKLGETTLTAYKLAAKEYIGYEEEEDSIIPILPIIRNAIIRRMARSSDIAMLRGTGAGVSDPIKGVAQLAIDAGGVKVSTLSIGSGDKVTAVTLQTARRGLGTWGLSPGDVTYIVSQDAYYDLLEDPDFRTMDVVGTRATILNGQIGSVNGSPVVVSGEFEAKAATKTAVVAVNTSNFIAGNLRSVMVERDRNIEDQRNIIVATRRVGFIPVIAGAGVSVINWAA